MKQRHIIFILTGLYILSLVLCSVRDRNNPFDPKSDIGQDQFNFHLKSDQATVTAQWSPIESPDLTGYNIYRARVGNPLQLIGQTEATDEQFIDPSITQLQTYAYGVSALGDEDETSISSLDTITPGPSRWWALALDVSPLKILSHDGLHLFTSEAYQYSGPELIAPVNRTTAFIYDQYGNTIFRQVLNQNPTVFLQQSGLLRQMLYLPASNQLMLIKNRENRNVVEFYAIASSNKQSVRFSDPALSGAVDSDGRIWVGTTTGLYQLAAQTKQNLRTVLLDSALGVVEMELGPGKQPYFVNSKRDVLFRVTASDGIESVLNTQQIWQLKYDPFTNILWLRTFNQETKTYSVFQYDGVELSEVLTGLKLTYTFEVNPVSHVCLIPDYANRRVYAIDPDGSVRSKTNVAGSIYYIKAQSLEN